MFHTTIAVQFDVTEHEVSSPRKDWPIFELGVQDMLLMAEGQ